jgi:hypothetical protein
LVIQILQQGGFSTDGEAAGLPHPADYKTETERIQRRLLEGRVWSGRGSVFACLAISIDV